MEWQTKAACKRRTELFFPAARERAEAQAIRVQKALAICGGCSVQGKCQETAARIRAAGLEIHGIWAGQDYGW